MGLFHNPKLQSTALKSGDQRFGFFLTLEILCLDFLRVPPLINDGLEKVTNLELMFYRYNIDPAKINRSDNDVNILPNVKMLYMKRGSRLESRVFSDRKSR